MQIQVKASNPGHPGVWRAGRHFTNGVLVTMAVVPKAEAVDANGNGPLGEDGRPSMDTIDQAGFEKVKTDGRLSWFSEAGDSAVAAKLSGAEATIVQLEQQIKALTEENAALKASSGHGHGATEGDKGGEKKTGKDKGGEKK